MQQPQLLWRVYSVAKAFKQRPSDLLGISEDEWMAWCVDEVVWTWGVYVEAEIRKAEKGKRQDTGKGAQKRKQEEAQAQARVDKRLKELLGNQDEDPQTERPAGKFVSFT